MESSHEPESFRGLLLRHRARTGLTQRDLAALVGVSVQSVQDWEGGLTFPAAPRLQQLIRALLQAGALTPGRESVGARELWMAAERDAPRMRSPFDEQWFAGLLVAHATPTYERPLDAVPTEPGAEDRPGVAPRGTQDWGEAPDTTGFVGRGEELALLRNWVVEERCRLVALLGFGGIGKTALAARLAQSVVAEFERVYWRTLHTPRPVGEWLAGATAFLSGPHVVPPKSESEAINALLDVLRASRCLVVLDNVESLFEPGQRYGLYRPGMEGYGRLLQAVGDIAHQSCVVVTSREAPPDLIPSRVIQGLELHGLGTADGQALLSNKQLKGDTAAWATLVYRYGGNGLALKIVGDTIRQVYNGDLAAFLGATANSGTVFGGIRRLLDGQLERLTPSERDVLTRLAVEHEPIGLAELVRDMAPSRGRGAVIDAIQTLQRRSLVERGERGATFTLQSMVFEYVAGWGEETADHATDQGWRPVHIEQPPVSTEAQEHLPQTRARSADAPVRKPPARVNLLGRASERAAMDGLIADIRRGRSRSLVLRGQAGIGKTALLDYLVESASDLTIARAAGVESEVELAFASLQQLAGPMLDHLERLPGPQRQVLEIAFGLSPGVAPDQSQVGLAVLGLFSEVARERPLLCVVDDAQWLDRASALTLAFVARRLLAEPVGVVFAARQPGDELATLSHLEVRGLLDGDARALLGAAVRGKLDERVRDRIIAETQGNPLALLELPRGLTPTQLADDFGFGEAEALSGRMEKSFARRLEALSNDARHLLLLAAAEPVGDPLLLLRASEVLGIAVSGVATETEGLLALGEEVIFRHPLVRSAVYQSAAPHERRAVHRALAEATDRQVDPDRRAWHLAAGAAGPDEQVAVELERSAGRAQARGGLAAAAAFLERAVAMTLDPARRAERALAAAQVSVLAGEFEAAVRALATAEAGVIDELQHVRLDLLRAQLAFASRRGAEAMPLLLAAARRLEPLDIAFARETYLDAFSAALFGARLNDTVGVHDVAQAVRAAPRPLTSDATAADLLLDALVALTADYETAIPLCHAALQKLIGDRTSPKDRLRWLWQGCVLALEAWDDESAYILAHHSVQTARDTGTLSELALALSAHAPVLVLCGEFSAAASAVAETRSVEEATGISAAPYGALILAAWRGQALETRQLIEMTTGAVGSRGEGIGIAICEYGRAVLCNGLAQYEEALDAARSAAEYREVVAENWGLCEVIEAAVRAGRPDLAMDSLNRLATKARAAATPWARGIEARSRALLSEGDRAEDAFREAFEHLQRARVRAELARTRLLYGEWLWRENRRVDARVQLWAAHDELTAIGMEAFAERARKELLEIGELVQERAADKRHTLTSQEAQIAQLARDGLSNPDIGARLFLSPRTVEWHMSNAFTKLGIGSSGELADALTSSDSRPDSALRQ